jgi:hypothetical protein
VVFLALLRDQSWSRKKMHHFGGARALTGGVPRYGSPDIQQAKILKNYTNEAIITFSVHI